MTYPKYIFLTGPPGSRWSGISQELRKLSWIDNSDITDARQYSHNLYSGHIGAYFGPEMEHGDWLKEGFYFNLLEKEISSIWSGQGTKILMSHNWCYYFDEIQKYYPNETIITVTRDNLSCYNWWHEAGGWNITYPSYTWYKNNVNMKKEIKKQNHCIKNLNKFEMTYEKFFKLYSLQIKNNKFSDLVISIINKNE
tara:strand:+ start:1256 stop:1843 length:588 start_codon:yes stop_codon:yes gene_type:complete